MNRLLSLLLLSCCLWLVSCTSPFQSSPEKVRAAVMSQGIVVADDPPKLRFIGTTVFNNGMEDIPDPGFSFGDHLVKKLKARGYKARKGSDRGNIEPTLSLHATHPYQQTHLSGAGVGIRTFFGNGLGPQVHCNYHGFLTARNPSLLRSSQPKFGKQGYFFTEVQVAHKISKWSDFTADDKRRLRVAMEEQMNKASDHLLSELGL